MKMNKNDINVNLLGIY